jgi:Ca2+-binding RTX toxin-like protein
LNIINGTALADRLRGTSAADLINGLGGNDRLEGREGDDILQGGAGNDVLLGQDGNDVLQGGEGDDRLHGGAGDDLIDGGAGRDTLISTGDGNFVATQTGLTGPEGTDAFINIEVIQLTGGIGNNTLDASALTSIQAVLKGGAGNDTLLGGQGRDNLNGEAGNDLLVGGLGKDTLAGGNGADTFDYRDLSDSLLAGFDVIKDFNAAEDFLRVRQLPTLFTANAGAVTKLDATQIQGILTPAVLANPGDSAVFSFGSRIFAAINDGTAGFQKGSDAVLELAVSGLVGSLSLANFTV